MNKPRHTIDIFNGDADGLIARHQYRLAHPVSTSQRQQLHLISGVKRDIALASQALALVNQNLNAEYDITVFDISYDQNAEAIEQLLALGAHVRYFDHHLANLLKPLPNLAAQINLSPEVCTSLLVDRLDGVKGAYRQWAITAAFGDNLIRVATGLAIAASLSPSDTALLRELGECLNYNAYGETGADLYFHPLDLAVRLAPYRDPLEFIRNETVFATLKQGLAEDLKCAMATAPYFANEAVAIVQLPDQAWARRVSGVFANRLTECNPNRAHAVLTANSIGSFTVSIRAPMTASTTTMPRAAQVAIAFAGGGGRTGAAGINRLPGDKIEQLIDRMKEVFQLGK